MSTNFLAQFSANLSTMSAANINYSTLSGSTIIASSITSNSTINVSSITTRTINYSTIMGSTINANTVTIASTITTSSILATGNIGIGNINTSGNIIATNFASTDFTLGNAGYSVGKWLTLNTSNVQGTYPTSGYNIGNSLSIGGNFTNSLSEIDFMNNLGTGFNFYNRSATSAASLLFNILGNGNVGIGTAGPYSKLDISSSSASIFGLSIACPGETYGLGSSAKNTYTTAGTLVTIGSFNAVASAGSIIDYSMQGSNGNTNVYAGGIAGPTGNGAGIFVIGRRTAAATWTESMRIDTSGNVGIGTATPGSYKLAIQGDNTNAGIFVNSSSTWQTSALSMSNTNTSNNWQFTMSAATGNWGEAGALGFYSSTYGGFPLVIRTNGNVGIGTSNPLSRLYVYSNTGSGWDAQSYFGNATTGFVCGTFNNGVLIGGHNGALNAWTNLTIGGGGTTTTFDGTGYFTGSVGIGTTTPLANVSSASSVYKGLDIQGSTNFDGATILRILNPASQYGRCSLHIIGRNESDNDSWSLINGRNTIIFGYQTSFNSAITYSNSIQSLFGALGFFSSGYSTSTPALIIAANGNVSVSGSLSASSITSTTGTFSGSSSGSMQVIYYQIGHGGTVDFSSLLNYGTGRFFIVTLTNNYGGSAQTQGASYILFLPINHGSFQGAPAVLTQLYAAGGVSLAYTSAPATFTVYVQGQTGFLTLLRIGV